MDAERFDGLAKVLAVRGGRRGVVLGLVVVVLGRGTTAGAQPTGPSVGDPCADVAECQATNPGLLCGDNGMGEAPVQVCCLPEGMGCGTAADCCAGLTCAPNPNVGDAYDGPAPPGAARCVPGEKTVGLTAANPSPGGLNLRAEPSMDAAVLLVIPQGAIVWANLHGAANGFVTVEYAGVAGWAASQYLACEIPDVCGYEPGNPW